LGKRRNALALEKTPPVRDKSRSSKVAVIPVACHRIAYTLSKIFPIFECIRFEYPEWLQTTDLPNTTMEVLMRLLLSNAFLSIVSNPADTSSLTVRASRAGDIETVFGQGFEVVTLPGHVYPFRAFIPRRIVADTIAAHVFHINYGKFREAVVDAPLYDVYTKVYDAMVDLRDSPQHGTPPRNGLGSL